MNYILVKCFCVVLATLLLCFDVSWCALPSNNENSLDGNTPRQNQEKFSSTLWFGPRMGRKKRTDKLDDRKLADLLESLEEYPWKLIAINENNDVEKRGNTHNFTPRLGRTLEDNHHAEDFEISERSPPFSPRLGRGNPFSSFSPRLGRDEAYV